MDDLTVIRGIGPARAAELVALGVTTFAELFARKHTELAVALRVPAETAAAWVDAAGKLAGVAAPPAALPEWVTVRNVSGGLVMVGDHYLFATEQRLVRRDVYQAADAAYPGALQVVA